MPLNQSLAMEPGAELPRNSCFIWWSGSVAVPFMVPTLLVILKASSGSSVYRYCRACYRECSRAENSRGADSSARSRRAGRFLQTGPVLPQPSPYKFLDVLRESGGVNPHPNRGTVEM